MCGISVLETSTDDAGSFSLPATSHFTLIFCPMCDNFAQWNICIESDELLRVALSRNLAGTPRRVHLSCYQWTDEAVECFINNR